MPVQTFKEDFFERIINVKWTDEKKVHWIAGDAQSATYSYGSKWYTSSDGKSWAPHPGGDGGTGDLYGYTSGLWMRQGFNPEAGGLWILGGEGATPDGMHRKAGIQISYDGVSLGPAEWYDEDHFCGQFFVNGEINNGTVTREDIWYDHADIWTSSDGVSYSGGLYHPDWQRSAGPRLITPFSQITPVEVDLPEDFQARGAIPLVGATPMNRTQVLQSAMIRAANRGASPRAGNPLDERIEKYKLWDIYQLSNRNTAFGTMREGKGAGKVVRMRGGTPVGWHGPGSAAYSYFRPNCTMTDMRTGKGLGKSNCGVQYGHSMAYGYYTFVVVGGDKAGNSLVSHTEDGVTWHTQTLNPVTPNMGGHSMWSLVVGPQPGEDKR